MNPKILLVCLIATGSMIATTPFAGMRLGILPVAALSLDQAAQKVRASAGGRVLGAESKTIGGRVVHVIKVLTPDGKRVRYIQVDAETGRVGSSQ